MGGMDTTEDEFRSHFSEFGNVVDVKKVHKRDGKDKGRISIFNKYHLHVYVG